MKRRLVLLIAIIGALLALTTLPVMGDTAPAQSTADVSAVPASAQVDCSSCHDGTLGEGTSAAVCKECHTDEYTEWHASGHAKSLEAAGGSVAKTESCQACHEEAAAQTVTFEREGVETDGPQEAVTCEVCHESPKDGWFMHFREGPHGEQNPSVDYTAELCGACHNGEHHPQYEEWNEAGTDDFDADSMASHSEDTEGYAKSQSCVSCKSTEGAILNLEAEGIYERNDEAQPKPEDVTDWRVSCAACHDPHPAELRIEDTTQLCANCHNTEHEDLGPTGEEQEVHHSQWEMYEDSKWRTNTSHPQVGCADCHMAQTPYVETDDGHEIAVTGHTFDFDAETLTAENQIEEEWRKCGKCHGDLAETVHLEETQIDQTLEHAAELKTEANDTLTELELRDNEDLLADYHDGSFWLSYLEHTGSVIHNPEKASEMAQKSVNTFEKVEKKAYVMKFEEQSAAPQTTEAPATTDESTPTDTVTTTATETPGMGVLAVVLSLMGAALLLKRRIE